MSPDRLRISLLGMPSEFSVIALISAYNEADIIEQVVSNLINQGVQVYFMDDGSTDGTVAAVERHLGAGVLGIERLANPVEHGASAGFDWDRILRRKTELATELDASWFIHHDADEFRESPWSHLSLSEAIRHVDGLGFNAIDFMGLDFWPVDDRFRAGDDVRDVFTRYAELAPYDRVQVRCWKKTAGLDLASSGGHEARFAGRRVFPLRFILRHYPIRGQSHGERKVFQERRNRFHDQERARGWHVQYDRIQEGVSFLRDPSTLTAYDPEGVRLSLTLHPRYPEELEAALGAARLEIDALARENDALHRENDAAAKHIDHVTAQLIATRGALRDRETEAAALRCSLEQRAAELDARSAQVAALVEALDRRAEEVGRWRTTVDRLTRQLDEFQRSLSWRWTAPARTVFRMFRGS
jgi:hypothetical protein